MVKQISKNMDVDVFGLPNKNMKKLSIIIPIYNSEKYLERCLNSIKNQTFKDFEVILINDASIDNSQKIINKYTADDARFISISNKENIKQGLCRNLGIEKSDSEYITFIDSDDWINEETYEKIFNSLKQTPSDIIEFNFKSINEKNPYIRNLKSFKKCKNDGISNYILYLYNNNLGQVIWNKVYHSDLIKKII